VKCHSFFLVFFCLFVLAFSPLQIQASDLDVYDSLHMSTLNMTEAEIKEVYGSKDSVPKDTVTLQQRNEENPSYIKREYDHKEQVIVGSLVMLCVALAMVFMNNYNPRR